MTTAARALVVVAVSCFIHSPARVRAETYCGATNPSHDAPSGYIIFSRAQKSVIKPVINSLGEFRTHTMLSHGEWITHATMKTPTSSSSTPHLDPTQLRFGDPGASQMSSQAAYTSLYGPDNGGVEFIAKQSGGAEGGQVASWFWNSMPYRWVGHHCGATVVPCYTSYYDCNGFLTNAGCANPISLPVVGDVQPVVAMGGGGYYRLQATHYPPGQGPVTVDIPYSLHQYADIQSVNLGSFGGADGAVCSTLQAFGVHRALGRTVEAPTYAHSLTAASMNQLHGGVFSACKASDKGLLGSFVDFVLFGSISDSKCNEAGNQVVNCLINVGNCASSGSQWTAARDNNAVMARSISPDHIGGWRPFQQWWDWAKNAPWSTTNSEPISFSGGGTVYSCWGNG
jgi:hypothetical protein